MISHKYKFIFTEIPKTGTTSICGILEKTGVPPTRKHLDLFQYRKLHPEIYPEYFKFSFVRNPWDRTVSLYHRRERLAGSLGLQKRNLMSFSEFVDWIECATDACMCATKVQGSRRLDHKKKESTGFLYG